jgi:predicted phage gp36 major capsid-like protein
MTTELKPWVSAELEPSKKKQALNDELRMLFREMWAENPDDFQGKATSTDNEDSINGTLEMDKNDVPLMMSKYAKQKYPDSLAAAALPSEIKYRFHHAAADTGKDRKTIAARKAEFLAIGAAPTNGIVPVNGAVED